MTAAAEDEPENGIEFAAPDFDQALTGMASAPFAEADQSDAFSASLQRGSDSEAAGDKPEGESSDNSALIAGLPVMMKVVLGSAKMPVSSLAKLAKGSVVKLDRMVGDPVEILVNGRLIARGEVVVLNEGSSRFGIVLTEVGKLTQSNK
jgi:flagellar motor switch protein FliN/FliY